MWTEAKLKRAGELLDDDEEQEEDYEEDQGEETKKCWLTICESQEWIGVFFFYPLPRAAYKFLNIV